MNRDLIISLFRDVELPRRIMGAQTKNDEYVFVSYIEFIRLK